MPPVRSLLLFILFILPLVAHSCGSGSDSGKNFVAPQGHPDTWANPVYLDTDKFHGNIVAGIPPANEPETGADIFKVTCACCHGKDASGKAGPNGPNIKGAGVSLIKAAISSVGEMKGMAYLSDDEIALIAGFLTDPVPEKTPVIQTQNCKQCHGETLDGGIAGISCYACHSGPDGTAGHEERWLEGKNDPVHYHGTYGMKYTVACTFCHGDTLRGKVGPDCFSCHGMIEKWVPAWVPRQ